MKRSPAQPQIVALVAAISLGVPITRAHAATDEAVPDWISASLPKPSLRVTVAPKKAVPSFLAYAADLSPGEATNLTRAGRAFELESIGPSLLAALRGSTAIGSVELVFPNEAPTREGRVPRNRDARLSHNVQLFESNFSNSGGQDTSILVLDSGSVRPSHVEFRVDRVSLLDGGANQTAHSTHVAGTVAAAGVDARARGMAPKAKIVSGTFYDDLEKLESVASRIQVSNHSYGPSAGWGLKGLSDGSTAWVWYGDVNKSDREDVTFGRYTSDCVRFDSILANNPLLTSVVAAGNDRNDEPDFQPIEHLEIRYDAGDFKWVRSSDIRERDGGKFGGVDTLSGLSTCKNSLGVGAINDQFDDGVALKTKITTTVFSSWGPTDDGRIKPEVVANGQELLSATIPPEGAQKPDEVYDSMSGTSMASPTAAGIVAILAEYYHAQRGSQPTSAMMRALLAHSATDAGLTGPDAVYGYGSINAFRAGELIRAADGALILEQRIKSGEKYSLKLRSNGRPVRVALAWIDPPGTAAAGPINDRTPVLVNDLDLSLVSPAGVTLFPYALDVATPMAPAAATRANRVDNLEIIDAPIVAGVWRVDITAPALKAVSAAGQAYSLVISGLSPDPSVDH